MRRGDGRIRLLLGVLLGGAVLLLALAQVLLPRIAASTISSRVGRYGAVESVKVRAWPAIELLWGSVDLVQVRAGSLELSPRQAAALLWEGRDTASMDVTARSVRVGPLLLSNARLRKRGGALSGEGTASAADVRAALPPGFDVQLVGSEDGRVRVRTSGGLFGVGASVGAVGEASEGRLIARPLGLLLGGIRLTLFEDEHVYVDGVGASVASERPLSYRLTMSASLR